MSINELTEQEQFWAEEYAKSYMEKNSEFDSETGTQAWETILDRTSDVTSILECGSNIGKNIGYLEKAIPNARKSIIEVSKPAYEFVTNKFNLANSFNGTILDADFDAKKFDLVFTMGVMIHIHPDNLLANMSKIYSLSSKYIVIGEYFNRTPVSIEYQGKKDQLFKCDFGKLFLENFDVSVVDYGFLWGHFYDKAGFDDITWWVFQK